MWNGFLTFAALDHYAFALSSGWHVSPVNWWSILTDCHTAELWRGPGLGGLGPGTFLAKHLCSAPHWSPPMLIGFTLLCSVLCPSALLHLLSFSSVRKRQSAVFSLWWEGKVLFQSQVGAVLDSCFLPWSLLLERSSPNPHSLIGSKGTFLIG